MEVKELRDNLQLGIYKVINPFVRGLIKIGFTPNAVTTIGLLLNIGVAVIFILGAERSNRGDMSYIGWGGALVLFAGLFDMLDGQVARLGNMSSRFGALYDSVLDRYSEMIMFLGICYYLVAHHYFLSSLFAFIALIGSMMVSYTRARAEGLGVACKGGLMQRPERVVTIGVFAVSCGIAGSLIGGDYKLYVPSLSIHVFETISIFTLPITLMAILTNITAVRRLQEAKRGLDAQDACAKKHADPSAVHPAVIIVSLLITLMPFSAVAQTDDPSPVQYPTPKGISNQLFFLQRDPNTNTIICQLNVDAKGKVNTGQPVNVFWMRYADHGEKKELSYIQRKFAYGISSKHLGKDEFELRFVSHKKLPMYLVRSNLDQKYHVYATINGKKMEIERIFLRIEGGSFWFPNVKYVDIRGREVSLPEKLINERIRI